MSQTEVTKNALLKGLCKDCVYFAEFACTRIADKSLMNHLENDILEKEEDVSYEDLLEYTRPNSSCKFWEKTEII